MGWVAGLRHDLPRASACRPRKKGVRRQTCARLLEYKLYLPQDLKRNDYTMGAVRIPSLAEYQAGDTRTLCAVLDNPDAPDEGGSSADIVGDLYRPIPG